MFTKQSLGTVRMMKLAVASIASFAMHTVVAQDLFFIEHKPTGNKMMVCDGELGKPVTSRPHSNQGECVQWERVQNGDFFHLRSVHADKYIKPDTSDNGSPISIQPNTWTGNWTQWSYDDRGDGFGHIVNRGTGKLIFLSAKDRANVAQQPASWRGDFTRWAFVPLNGAPTPVPAEPAVVISNNAEFGDFLVGGADSPLPGFTLYTFANDNGGPNSNCNGQCAVVWPPLLIESEADLKGPASVNLGTTVRDDDTIQVTFNNEPLYFYREDNAPGDTVGHNVGGVWFVAQVDAGPTPTPTSTPTGSPSPTPPVCTPGAPPEDVIYEAELGQILGSASLYDDAAASGGQGVAFISTQNAGFSITTSGNERESRSVTVRYASELSGSLSYRIDGVDAGDFNFSSSGAWTGSYSEIVIPASIPPGATFDVFFDSGDTAMNVDMVTVSAPAGGNCGPTSIPTATPTVTPSTSPGTPTPTPSPNGPTPTPSPAGPTPTPDPSRTPLIPPSNADGSDFCLTENGEVTHVDLPFRANYHFLCLNGNCQTADLVDGVWVKGFGPVTAGQTYEIKTQLDHTNGECGIIHNVVPGQCVASSCLPPDEENPTAPTNLALEGRNGQAVRLSWSAATDNREVSRYEIFRDGRGIDYVSGSTLTFNDAGLNESTDYTYEVRACDGASNCSSFTPAQTVNTGVFVPDLTPPSVPAQLAGEAISETEINLTWVDSTDAAGVVSEYRLTRNGLAIATVNESSYSDTGLEAGTEYSYTVVACDDSNNCSRSSPTLVVETLKPDFSYLNWTYNKHDSTDVVLGITMTNHNGNQVGPEARNDGPEFLPTPFNGSAPSSHGFAFDISGNQLTWRWGGNIFRGPGDSGLEMHCSDDGGATYTSVAVSGGTATIPCTSNNYVYFFRYVHPLPLNNNPASAYIYTAPFTISSRVDPANYTPFTDGSANWMRFRHPVAHDGITAAVIDAQHNGDRLRHLDRYVIYVDDAPGNVQLTVGVQGNIVRNDVHRNDAGNINGQQQFSLTQNPGFGNAFSYGQTIQFELTAVAGGTGAQTYNDFSYYQVGYGWNAYGDPRLASAGKASTTMWFSDNGTYSDLEYNAVFTQPVTTLNKEQDVDDFIVGHHLFHGIDPGKNGSTLFDDPAMRIGERSCGDCHFRDGRGSEVINTPRGPRLPPPTYGVKLLESIEGREVGFRWDGGADTVADQVNNALAEDHKVNPNHLPNEVVDLIVAYTEMLTVPARDPGSYDRASVRRGDVLFNEIGCADCHTPVQKTRADVEAPWANLTIRPYTDMKLWDLGEGSFRTAPLWGLGHNLDLLRRNNREALFMHDGGSTSIEDAISRHGSSGSASRGNYNGLSASDKDAVIDFVKTL